MYPTKVENSIKGVLLDDGLVLIKLPFTGAVKFKSSEDALSVTAGQEIIVDRSVIGDLFRVYSHSYISGWRNVDTAETITVEQHATLLKELDVRDEDCNWPSIQARHAHELARATWIPVNSANINVVPLVITLESAQTKLDNPYITPMWKFGGDPFATIYIYDRAKHIRDLVEKLFAKAGFAIEVLENSFMEINRNTPAPAIGFRSSGQLEFTRLRLVNSSDSYLTTTIGELKSYEKLGQRRGNLAELEAIFNADNLDITTIINKWMLRTLRAVDVVDQPTFGEIVKLVQEITNNVRLVQPKVVSVAQHNEATKNLGKLKKLLDTVVQSRS